MSNVILNKDTRDLIKIGTLLKDNVGIWKVDHIENVYSPYGVVIGKRVSLECVETLTDNRWFYKGKRIYMSKLSDYYGCEIINKKEDEDNE